MIVISRTAVTNYECSKRFRLASMQNVSNSASLLESPMRTIRTIVTAEIARFCNKTSGPEKLKAIPMDNWHRDERHDFSEIDIALKSRVQILNRPRFQTLPAKILPINEVN